MDCIVRVLPTLSHLKTSLVIETDTCSFTLDRTKSGLYEFDVPGGSLACHFNRTLDEVITMLPTFGVPTSVILLDHDPEDPDDEEQVLF